MPDTKATTTDEAREQPAWTPGPWAVEDPLGPDILSIVAGGPEVYDWVHVAQIGVGNEVDGDPPRLEAEANARLIAAAPTMAEAIEPFAALLESEAEDLEGAPDDMPIGQALREASQPTVGDLRRAAAALASARGDQ